MKKIWFLPVFLLFAVSSFAENISNRHIFIEGSAVRQDILEFFLINFRLEAVGSGFTVVENREEAAFILNFDVSLNPPAFQDLASPAENFLYIIEITLIRGGDEFEVLTFNFFFNFMDEMLNYNRELFLRAVSLIPPIREADTIAFREDRRWQNKWWYFRISIDYPITFFALQNRGLLGGTGVYHGDIDNPTAVMPLGNIVSALPGFTLGAELQFLNFMIIALNYHFFLGTPLSNDFVNITSGAELKFPIKTRIFKIAPFLALSFPLRTSPEFDSFPVFAFGGGLQIGVRSGRRSAFFVTIRYLQSPDYAARKNPFGDLFPNPSLIYYRHHIIGFGIGYKFGIADRRTSR